MKRNHTYLCGPIEGLTHKQQTEWRDIATSSLANCDIATLDPCRRVNFVLDKSPNAANRVFKCDLQDIANSTVILANLTDSLPGKKWGSVAEVAHAHTHNKIIIVIIDKDQFHHPFITSYATEIHYTLDDAIAAVTEYYL